MDNKWSLEIIKQSKHGTTCIALPSRLFVIDLTVHVDILANPGPDVQLKSKYGKLNDHHLPCVINTQHSIQYSSGWLVHSSHDTSWYTPDTSWYTPEIQEQKIIKRRLERRWRTTKLMVDREVYSGVQCSVVNRLISAAKTNYYKDMINSGGSDQREFFKKFVRIFKTSVKWKYPSCASTDQLENNLADFFDKKVDSIRKKLSTKPANTAYSHNTESILLNEAKLESFAPITVEDMLVLTRNLIKKSCVLDPIPAKVPTECYTDLIPVITNITNTSLGTATVPDNLKIALLILDL